MKNHVNIPIFIPHLGCPNQCVFCNQRAISGQSDFCAEAVEGKIRQALSTVPAGCEREIAFFGGSFTGIDRELMTSLLACAAEFVERGEASGIRLSTRPDYIDGEILAILKRYPVRTVELGLQSLDDRVLAATRRGHTAACAERACREVVQAGFSLVGQMMIGLPASDGESERQTARKICGLGADAVRVYPTVVFRDTELAGMTGSGEYVPLTCEEAVRRTKDVLMIFDGAGIPCIRVGLCAGESLSDPEQVLGGANHSAIGELAMGEVYYERLCRALDKAGYSGGTLTVYVAVGAVSRASGQNRRNKVRICEKYGFEKIKVLEKNEIIGYNIILEHTPAGRAPEGRKNSERR